ncbi:MAG: DUF805 domain-containing protein [Bacteroidales bacterium]|uniref:DUF805 domain-containing protein n=1 Tax=Porphyromonas sp. TaxID=1924944 RepID=UPI002979E5B1|nr:DUF805 domain-containing protein [Porphyromonas sp.]MDD7437798.1 DUF805 domain-containing protein [Bacteroidales bacterium]MDY3066626.1 DUF805 domain-containing protein [Porphyromonas sp.]
MCVRYIVLRQYADFRGRARRKEYWYFVLFNCIFALIAIGLDNLLGITFSSLDLYYGPIYLLYVLATFIPNLAVSIRRLHDIGESGWWTLISLIPIIGAIWLIILYVTDSQP